ncbi:MAG: TadE/TadG family type IV pilus assembly protein [Maioricimonas sp. JB045]
MTPRHQRIIRHLLHRVTTRLRKVHTDERGTISILTVFCALMFTMLLILLINVARQLDDKIKMQNAADAAGYSGGVILARGMNAIAFTNHLEADVFAVTAFLREARDRNAERQVPQILQAWQDMASDFSLATRYPGSPFDRMAPLAAAIPGKVPLEQTFVTNWSEMAAGAAQYALPVFEYILGTPETVNPTAGDHLIPNFQRALLATIPTLASEVTNEIALRHGVRQEDLDSVPSQLRDSPQTLAGPRGPQFGVLWRTTALPVGVTDEFSPMVRTLPVVDPDPYQSDYYGVPDGAAYLGQAQERRAQIARDNLRRWIRDRDPTRGLDFADEEARMSQFARLFWTAACAHLDRLLNEEYPNTNVPMMIRDLADAWTNENIDSGFTFVSVVYRQHVDTTGPGMYFNPLNEANDAQTFAEIRLFIPRPRFLCCPWIAPSYGEDSQSGNILGWHARIDNWSQRWDTFNQNWMVKVVPATSEGIPLILQSPPGGQLNGFRHPDLGLMEMRDLNAINTH